MLQRACQHSAKHQVGNLCTRTYETTDINFFAIEVFINQIFDVEPRERPRKRWNNNILTVNSVQITRILTR
jgi:hypothetical protein